MAASTRANASATMSSATSGGTIDSASPRAAGAYSTYSSPYDRPAPAPSGAPCLPDISPSATALCERPEGWSRGQFFRWSDRRAVCEYLLPAIGAAKHTSWLDISNRARVSALHHREGEAPEGRP